LSYTRVQAARCAPAGGAVSRTPQNRLVEFERSLYLRPAIRFRPPDGAGCAAPHQPEPR